MRLLVVSQYFWPENFRVNDLVAELVRRGHQVTVLTGQPNYPGGRVFEEFRKNPGQFAAFQGAHIVRVPLLPRGKGGVRLLLNYLSFALSASLLGPWKLRRLEFDAIFTCQLSPVTVGIPAIILRRIKRTPMAMWVLDLWPDTLQAVGVVRSSSLLKALGWLVGFIYRRCDLILAQSRSFIPKIQGAGSQKTPVAYFPSWAESVFTMNGATLASEVPLKPGCFNVMFAGNIGDAQDFPAILSAAEILKSQPNIRWLIVGDGRKATWVADEIKRRHLEGCVLMLGRHPVERMPSFYKHANALLVSLRDEAIYSMTIPGKLQSYLASGIPVLAMLNGEGAGLIRTSGAGLTCNAGDHAALAEAVLRLAEMNEQQRLQMGQRGIDLNRQEFSRDKLMDQLECRLRELEC